MWGTVSITVQSESLPAKPMKKTIGLVAIMVSALMLLGVVGIASAGIRGEVCPGPPCRMGSCKNVNIHDPFCMEGEGPPTFFYTKSPIWDPSWHRFNHARCMVSCLTDGLKANTGANNPNR